MKHPMVIVGGVAAGMSAASKARRLKPDLPIFVFEKSGFVSYGACGMPYYLSDVIADHNKMVIRTPEFYAEKMNIQVKIRHEVTKIDAEKKQISVTNLDTGETFEQPYSTLIYATGARPIVPDLPGIGLEGVYTLRTLDDGLVVKEALNNPDIKRVVIIGGGFIGLEVAENLRLLDKEVHIVEKATRVLINFDPEFSQYCQEELEKHGVQVHCDETLMELTGKDRVKSVKTEKGEYPCDMAILCIGVTPNSELAREAGIQVGFKNAVVVDRQMRTNQPDILAAGDCAETYHRLLKKNLFIPLGTTANRQGRLAGVTACGVHSTFAGVLGTAVAKIFDVSLAITGVTEQCCKNERIDMASTMVSTLDHAIYYPNARKIRIKLVYDRKTSVILGGQIFGYEGVAHRADIIATAITNEMTLEELGAVDMCYAPPYKGVWEAVTVAANVAQAKWEEQQGQL
jgi:NADPH-dependent 2,4-dienoyl-CoA reductase/sulfur reductase-like enzyme